HYHAKAIASCVDEQVIYICPMHPEIHPYYPGHCPICGMTLELKTGGSPETTNPEYFNMRRRFWIALILSLPLFILTMGEQTFKHLLSVSTINWLEFLLATPVVLG